MTVPKGYSPLLTAMRESSIHRAIIALSVAFSEESMSTLPYRLASIKVNPDVKPVLGH
jgi:hypothetical protein